MAEPGTNVDPFAVPSASITAPALAAVAPAVAAPAPAVAPPAVAPASAPAPAPVVAVAGIKRPASEISSSSSFSSSSSSASSSSSSSSSAAPVPVPVPAPAPQPASPPIIQRPRLASKDYSSGSPRSGVGLGAGNGDEKSYGLFQVRAKLIDSIPDKARASTFTESCVGVYGDFLYPKIPFGVYGYNAEKGRFPIDSVSSLGMLRCPLRKPTCAEKWSPMESSLFEACITLYGKNFHRIATHVGTKSVQEVIEYYYFWKKTSHHKEWKKMYTADERTTHNTV